MSRVYPLVTMAPPPLVLVVVLASALGPSMLLVQLAIRLRAADEAPAQQIAGVWLGLDVAWDVYIGLGTACFAIGMLRHPRFGTAMGIVGLVLVRRRSSPVRAIRDADHAAGTCVQVVSSWGILRVPARMG